jgi:DNA-binding MarR family transcriptional regulator
MSGRAKRTETARDAAPPLLSREDAERRYRESGYDLAQHAAHVIRRAHQRATATFVEVMGDDSLTPTQFAALATILREGELSQIQLARATAMDRSTITLVMRKLLRLGFVERSIAREDQRVWMVRLTAKGQHYTLARLSLNLEVARRTLAPLSPSEQQVLMALLRRIGDLGETEAGDTRTARGRRAVA